MNMSSRTIYLVEDNNDNAALVEDLLGERYSIVTFPDALSLVNHLGDDPSPGPDLFILDISLPQMDGVTLLKRIRSDVHYQDVPAMALTAHAMKDDRRRLLQVGFDEYLSKPILDDQELVAIIEKLLKNPLV